MKRQRMVVWSVLIAGFMVVVGCIQGQRVSTQGWSDPVGKVVSFHVTGKGIAPENALNKGQALLMAEKAAVADGYRKLVERIRGVYVDAYLRSGRGAVDYDIVQAHTQAWLRGAEVLETRQADFGITEVYMRLRVSFTKRGTVWWPVGIESDTAGPSLEQETLYSDSGN